MLLGRAGAQAARAIPVSGASGECALEQKPRGASPFASAYVRRRGGSALPSCALACFDLFPVGIFSGM